MIPGVGDLKRPTSGTEEHIQEVIDNIVTGRMTERIYHLQEQVELQDPLGERGSLILVTEEDQIQEIMRQDMKMKDMLTEARAEKEEGAMEQTESITMGGQADPEATAGKPNV